MILQILALILALNVMATVTLWQQAARKPPSPKKKFIKSLFHAEPIVPKHDSPATIGQGFPSLVSETDRLFFSDFTEFAAVVNRWFTDEPHGSPWRLQELPDTEVRLSFSDMPDFCRRYTIFYNQVRIGTLEVSPSFRYSTEEPRVHVDIELRNIRLLAFNMVRGFLTEIAIHISDDENEKERLQTTQCIDRALMRVVWEAQEISE